jgi:thymidylate synthase (FAD)
MKIIDQSYEILTSEKNIKELPLQIELAGRTCYKSEDKINGNSAPSFCRKLIKKGHEAMIEHGNISVRFITDRGVTHEIVRHRLAAFGQESTRYCNYGNKDIKFIRPVFDWAKENIYCSSDNIKILKYNIWNTAMNEAELNYKEMVQNGCSPQEARSVLPNSLKTEIVVTANVREWRHIFKLRVAKAAHPQIRELMKPLLKELIETVPCLFEDLFECLVDTK